MNPIYPVYVISKGRADTRLTVRSLENIGVPHSVVIEPQEYDAYAAVMDPGKLVVLPFSNLGQGSIPARNFVWEHAKATGAKRHWILDDNIGGNTSTLGYIGFYRYNKNLKTPVDSGTIFRCAEVHTDRYENVVMSGFNYFMFASRKSGNIAPFTLNTRVYSCILLRNDMPHRWRGRYNEDTDLSIRFLKDGYCTILYNAFLCMKQTTMTMKGGNSDELYQEDGRLKMAQSLVDQHPDVASVSWKWDRYQHHVDYSGFKKNKLVRVEPGRDYGSVDDFGMYLRHLDKPSEVYDVPDESESDSGEEVSCD